MDSLFHFVFAIIAGLAIGLHEKHGLRTIVLISFSAVLIDIDHYFWAYSGSLHNVFIALLLPITLFLIAFAYEKKNGSIRFQSYSLLLLVMLSGHIVADLISEKNMLLFYPLSSIKYGMPTFFIPAPGLPGGAIISSTGVTLAVYFIIIYFARFIEDFIYFFEKKHKALKKALGYSASDLT